MRWSSRHSATAASCLPDSLAQPVEVFRAAGRRACEERAFVLTAVGIVSVIEPEGTDHVVRVDASLRAHALHHLWHYESERRQPRSTGLPIAVQPNAWWGACVYLLVLLLVPVATVRGWFGPDLFAQGVLLPEAVRAGEWWRAVTALTLHWDTSHLLGNLGAGSLLGFCAAQVWGNARAWLLILLSATGANLLESLLAVSRYASAGASTAVFAALGLLAAHAWRTRGTYAHGARQRWVPLLAGIAVLALFGGGEAQQQTDATTNVLSHALGFAVGAGAGAVVAGARGAASLARLPASVAMSATGGLLIVAWMLAV
jgi:rhomboid protease GluP